MRGSVFVRDPSDPAAPEVELRLAKIGGRTGAISDIVRQDDACVGVVVLAGPKRVFYLVSVAPDEAQAKAVQGQLLRSLPHTEFL
jgi:hypothetical protein